MNSPTTPRWSCLFEIQTIVLEDEARFIRYFNEAGPITTRMHALELLPGIGKKLMWAVLNERKKGPFKRLCGPDGEGERAA